MSWELFWQVPLGVITVCTVIILVAWLVDGRPIPWQ
jgi:hypothetical protein